MVQLVPTLSILLFLLFALAFVAALAWFVVSAVTRGPSAQATMPLICVIALYVLLVAAGSAIARERRIPLGTLVCFDDWCATVASVHTDAGSPASTVSAVVRVVSTAKRVTMHGSDPHVYFIDSTGRWFRALPGPDDRDLNSEVAPGESFSSAVHARVPENSKIVAARIWEGGWLDRLVPFGEESPFHAKTFYAL
ncbi:MAG TPA: hypothetical protein VGZ02_08140 [Candidatus Baltobacteraceae bacterium]|jgi:hypothetical protein|nr:hypothetical protein [Candidatus Baltobacteraceae bacterium]